MTVGSTLVHANCLTIDGRGVLIRGAAGSGKTTLSLELIRRARTAGFHATLVADDQTMLQSGEAAGGQTGATLTGHCPEPIAGLVEIRPYGVVSHGLPASASVALDLVVDLVNPNEDVPRVQQGDTIEIEGVALASLRLPRHPDAGAAGAVFAALGLPCWT